MMIEREQRDGPVIELRLSWPPSVNKIWRNVVVARKQRTLLSASARQWFEVAAVEVMRQRAGAALLGRVHVDITLHAPDRRAIDIDNRAKAVLDALTKGGIWHDDGQVDVLTVRRAEVMRGGLAVVRVQEIAV